MKSQFKLLAVAGLIITAFSTNAVQRDITLIADIDPTVDVTLADGSPLPSSIAMQYLPGKGLANHNENIKFWSNSVDKDLNVSLASMAVLNDINGGNTIPLTVSVNGKNLSTTATTMAYATTFPRGISNGSSIMPLVIRQEKPGVVSSAGNYTGIVSLVVTQSTATPNG